jgi:hypothetical protein
LLKETVSAGRPSKNVPTKEQLPEGISRKQSHYAQTLADNIDTIEEVIQEAHENEESPRNGDRSHERKMSAFHSKNTGKNFIGVTFK